MVHHLEASRIERPGVLLGSTVPKRRSHPVMPMHTSTNPLAQQRKRAESPPSYRVGRDLEGYWVAVELKGLAGGIFRSREDAVHFACVEVGCRPHDVAVASDPIQFRI